MTYIVKTGSGSSTAKRSTSGVSAGVHGFNVMKKTVRCDMLKKILNYPITRVSFATFCHLSKKKINRKNEHSNII